MLYKILKALIILSFIIIPNNVYAVFPIGAPIGYIHWENGLRYKWDGVSWYPATSGWRTDAKASGFTVDSESRETLFLSNGAFTVTLTSAATLGNGFTFAIKNVGVGAITIDPAGTETIDGAATYTLTDINTSVELISNGTNWYIGSTYGIYPASTSYWDRDAINGEVYPATLTDKVGIQTTSPDTQLEVYNPADNQLRLTYTEGAVYSDIYTDSLGNLTIKPTSNLLELFSGNAGVDYGLRFHGETNTGLFRWMEDENYFEFFNDVKVPSLYADAIYLDTSIIGLEDVYQPLSDIPLSVAATAGTEIGFFNTLAGQDVFSWTAEGLGGGILDTDTITLHSYGDLEMKNTKSIIVDAATNPASITFNNLAQDTINITNAFVGINTTFPDRRLDVLSSLNPQLRLTYTDDTVYTDFQTDSAGKLNITTSAGKTNLVQSLTTATGNEIAYKLDYTTNKLTSGNDYGLVVNQTDTASPGTSYLADFQVSGVSKFSISNTGVGIFTGTVYVPQLLNTNGGTVLNIANTNFSSNNSYAVAIGGGTHTESGGTNGVLTLNPTYNQTSIAGATDLLINRTQTAVGTGEQNFIDAQISTVSKFKVNNAGTVIGQGGVSRSIVNNTNASYNATINNYTITNDATGGAITVNLPASATSVGTILNIKKTDATANAVTIDPNGAELIDGLSTYPISSQNTTIQIQCTGTGWVIL